MLKTEINGIIAGMEQDLTADLVRSTNANRLWIVYAVINQAGPDSVQG